jgi:hypothetical protein
VLYQNFKDEDGDRGTRMGRSRIDHVINGMEGGVKHLLNHLNSQEESYDGFLCFSQGSMVMTALYNVLQYKTTPDL